MHTVTLQFNVRPLGGPRKNLTTHNVAVLSLTPGVRPRPFSYSGVALTKNAAARRPNGGRKLNVNGSCG